MGTETPLLRVEEIQGRGRSLVATKALLGGQVILRDSPILLYSAFPFSTQSPYCDNCFRKLNDAVFACPACSHSRFCSPTCLASPSHSPWSCHALSQLRARNDLSSDQLQLQSRFLVSAYNLCLTSLPQFHLLLSLQGTGTLDDDVSAIQFLHSLIPPFEAASLEMTAALLSKDKLNAFGLMEPFDERNHGRRSVRAYGIYPRASFFNHDCLPNACRFDYVDGSGGGNTDIVVRMIHDVPEGREVCLSYFPVNLGYKERQRSLLEDYGFQCACDRCNVEANWSDLDVVDDDNGAMEDDGDGDDNEEDDEAMEVGSGGGGDDFPHAYFFLRFVCNREHCGGTLAPLPVDAGGSNLLECNVCGNVKKDEVV